MITCLHPGGPFAPSISPALRPSSAPSHRKVRKNCCLQQGHDNHHNHPGTCPSWIPSSCWTPQTSQPEVQAKATRLVSTSIESSSSSLSSSSLSSSSPIPSFEPGALFAQIASAAAAVDHNVLAQLNLGNWWVTHLNQVESVSFHVTWCPAVSMCALRSKPSCRVTGRYLQWFQCTAH